MTEKELKKLNRNQLLEMLIIQTERVNELEQQLQVAVNKLESRDVQISALGSIADASLQLTGVFEAAQSAADMYMNAAKERASEIEENATRQAEEILKDARDKAQQILSEQNNQNS